MSKRDANYIKFLEQATMSKPESPVDKIRDWDGKGDLDTRLQHKDLDDLMKKITGAETDADDKDGQEAGKTIKESKNQKKKAKSPISMLEDTKRKGDFRFKSDSDFNGIDEDISISEKESDMLRRLIKEMEAIDQNSSLSDIDEFSDEPNDDFSDESFDVEDEFADEDTYDNEDLPVDYVEPEDVPEDAMEDDTDDDSEDTDEDDMY